ncbi:putative adaptor protein Cbl domain superfamily [Helianthus annuus]|nr:putative adaptor protein Cbl domain superfamily [Helianthus annuus]
MADIVKQIIARPIQLADQIIKETEFACVYKQDCADIKTKTEKLGGLLRQAARASYDLYERPTRRIIDDTEQVLDKTLQLVIKCRNNGIRRIFTFIPKGAVKKGSSLIENSIGDVSWLLRVSTPTNERDDEYVGLPPIAANEPILCLVWEQIAILCCGTLEDRAEAAASLVSLARDNERYRRLIIEEGGVPPLLKLAKEGKMEGQESAVRAMGLLGQDKESVEQIVNAGVCSVFSKILKEGHMKVQIPAAWAVSEFAANYPECKDHFLQNNMIRLLVSHLSYETIEEHSKYTIVYEKRMASIVDMANSDNDAKIVQHKDDRLHVSRPGGFDSGDSHNAVTMKPPSQPQQRREKSKRRVALSGASIKGREFEDPATKTEMKAMAARALWHLCANHFAICKTITESRALLCFTVLLEKGEEEVKYNSAMALMEITAVAESHAELRRSAFKPTSPTARVVVDKLLKIVNKGESDLLIPSIQSIGNLARTFRATETRIIPSMVKLLDDREHEVSAQAAIALIKFACTDNYLHVTHCKAILEADAPKHLIQLTYFGELVAQVPGLILLCYIALHVPDSETLAQEDVHIVLQWALKQGHLMQDSQLETLVLEAKQRLEIYQSRA